MEEWTVYLSGEIHTDWREQIKAGVEAAGLPIEFNAPVTIHENSDDCGVEILGAESDPFWHDHKGEKYKQWNAAFDAGYAAALGKPIITMHEPEHRHALKEVDGAALAVARTADEIVQILNYVITGELRGRANRAAAE